MTPFPATLSSLAAPLMADNVDTDTIIPSREMRSTGRDGLADGLFAPWRYLDADMRTENPEFILNQPEFRDSTVLLGGANFGCGSSREHAVWALAEYGIQAIVAVSFAPIFRANCLRNGILPIALPRDVVEQCVGQEVTINLAQQSLVCGAQTHSFEIDAEAKQMMLDGLDAIDLTLTQLDAIDGWTKADRTARPWVYLEQTT